MGSDNHPIWKDGRPIRVVQALEIVISFSGLDGLKSHIEDALDWGAPNALELILFHL